jgi:His-Xaa-Ser system radical SAM maturase HxsB
MMASTHSRKFKSIDQFAEQRAEGHYYLMPFRFHRINADKEVLVNQVGDFIIVPTGTVEKVVSRRVSSKEDASLYADLIADHFISESPVPPLIDIVATRYRTKKSFLNDFTGLHIFVISLRCEHTCAYCQVSRVTSDTQKYDMALDVLYRGIDLMFTSPNPAVTMEFQGGEPLLAFDKIKSATEYAERLALATGKRLTIVICSNLALLTDEILSYCKEHRILLSTSLDGPKFIHDSNRKKPQASSYDLAVAGIERARAVLGHDQVSALMTTTSLSLDHAEEIVDEYYRMGFRSIFLRSISPYGFALRTDKNRYDSERFLSFYKRALTRIIEYNRNGHYFAEDYSRILLQKMLTPFNTGFVDLQSPAGLINGVIVFNYDGAVYASDESRMLAEQRDFTFRLGNIFESYQDLYFGEKAIEISEVSCNESLAGCSECAFQAYCGADPVHNHATQGFMYGHRPTSDFCHKNMETIRYLLELYDSDADVQKVFRSWLSPS